MRKLSEKFFVNIVANVIIFSMLLAVAVLGFGSQYARANSESKLSPIYRGNEDKKQVSLMINVYENPKIVEQMLEILNEKKAKATFFVGGIWAEKNPAVLRKIVAEGHELGNHGYLHKDHKKISEERNREEILFCDKLVKSLTDVQMKLFAPPSGSFSNATLVVAHNLGYKTIMWSKDTIDWRDKNRELIFSRATKNLKNGDLVLMHPTEKTVEALRDILDFYASNGFKPVTVGENIQ